WIRAVNNKGITTEGELKGGKVSGGTVRSEGRLSTGEYLQLDKTATAGTSCSPDGLVGRDSTGAILSCQSGSWKSIGSSAPWTSVTSFTLYPTTTKALGKFKLCVNTYRIDGKETAMTRVWPTDNPDANGEMNWSAYNGTLYGSYYITVHCFR
ncbi:TPA: shufflon system plasmid conjugative transfer pilus tip adhesin PilV, partial [Escherichia coli]